MPKEKLAISKFDGGVVESIDDRDIPDNAVSDIQNLRVDKPGQLLLMPDSRVHASFNNYNFGAFQSEITSRYGLHEFASDYKIDVSYTATTFATAESGAATTVTTSENPHSVCVGDMVRIIGSFDDGTDGGNYDGYFIVKTSGTNTFVIDKAFGSGQTSQNAYVIKINRYRDHQHRFLVMQDLNKFHVYDNQSLRVNEISLEDGFGTSMGGSAGTSDTKDVRPAFFDRDGILRVSDGNFNNLNNVHPRWYGYIPARPIGDYEDLRGSDETGFAAFTDSDGDNVTENSDVAGSIIQGMDFKSVETSATDAMNLVATGNATASLTDDRLVHVSFNMISFSSDYDASDPDGIGQLPAVYLANANNIPADGNAAADAAGTDRNSEIKIAQPGLNHMVFTVKNSGPEAAYVIFYTTNKHSFQIRQLRITGNEAGVSIGGFEQGYYDLPSTCFIAGSPEIQPTLPAFGAAGVSNKKIIGFAEDIETGTYDATTADPDGAVGAIYISTAAVDQDGDWFFASDHKYVQYGLTWLYDGDQESTMNPDQFKIVDGNNQANSYIELHNGSTLEGKSLDITIQMYSWPLNPRITGARLYLVGYGKTANEALERLEDPLLLATINAVSNLSEHERGSVTWCDGSVSNIISTSEIAKSGWSAHKDVLTIFPVLSYKTINTYEAYDNTQARWKQAVIINNRLYAGGIRQRKASIKDFVSGGGQTDVDEVNNADVLIESPVGKMDILPSRQEVTVVKNDGTSIIALKTFNGKLVMFKEEILYILVISEDYGPILEHQVDGISIRTPSGACDTDVGIIWTTYKGVYLYDGEQIKSLTEGKIDNTTWFDFVGWDGGGIGYSQRDQALMVTSMNEGNETKQYVYSMITQSWTKASGIAPPVNLSSNPVQWHWSTGIVWAVNHHNQEGENINVEETTAHVEPIKAEGGMVFSGGYLTAGDELYIKDSSNTARQVSVTMQHPVTDSGSSLYYIRTGLSNRINAYAWPSGSGYGVEAYSWQFNDNAFIALQAQEAGTRYNASGSASAAELNGLYFDADGTSPVTAESDANLTNATFTPLSGGVDGVAQVHRFHIERSGQTGAGITFAIWIAARHPDGSLIEGFDFTEDGKIEYTTVSSDDSQLVAEGLLAAVPATLNQYFTFSRAQQASTDLWYLQITGNYLNNTDTDRQKSYGSYQISLISATAINMSGNSQSLEIRNWHMSYNDESPRDSSFVYFLSKDIDFKTPGVRKKIYKVYITYRVTGASNINAYFIVDGKTDTASNRKSFASSTYYTPGSVGLGNGLLTTSGEYEVAELKPSTSSDANNIYSIKIVLESHGTVPKNFMINDFTIVYRTKSVK